MRRSLTRKDPKDHKEKKFNIQIDRIHYPAILACPGEQSLVIATGDLRDILSTYHIETWGAAQQPADNIVIEALVGQPFHRTFLRASSRSRRPFGDHSG
jgi:hypothetical protein